MDMPINTVLVMVISVIVIAVIFGLLTGRAEHFMNLGVNLIEEGGLQP